MTAEAEKLGEKRTLRFLQQQQYIDFRDQLFGIQRSFSSSVATRNGFLIGAATGVTYLATRDLGITAAIGSFVTGMELLRWVPDELIRRNIKRSLPLQADEIKRTESEIALLEQSLSAGGLRSDEIRDRLAALNQIERVMAQEAATKRAREAELAKIESTFDRAVNGSRNEDYNLEANALRWFTDTPRGGLNEWSAALRARGFSEIDIVRHQLMRFKQLEAANQARGDRTRISGVADNLQKQVDLMEVVEARHKTS